jgi:hypothetical protein
MTTGQGEKYGGDLIITTGNTQSSGIRGGNVEITTGYGISEGGSVNIKSGDSPQNNGGGISLSAGQGEFAGGDVTISGGIGSTANGGNISINAGSSSDAGGNINLNAGNGDIEGGNITLTTGEYYNSTDEGLVIINGSGTYSGTWTQASDRRLKKNIQSLNEQSDKVLKLNPVKYEMRKDEYPDKNLAEGEQIGLIAQEVEELFPQLVKTDSDGFKSIDYSKVSVLLLDVVKEQNEKLEKQNKLLKKLIQRMDRLENKNQISLIN